MSTTPLTDAIEALTTYANTVTQQNDPDLSSAVATLASGYGQGGVDLVPIMKAIGEECFRYLELPETLIFPNAVRVQSRCFGDSTGLKTLVLPAVNFFGTYPIADNTVIQTIDFGLDTPTLSQYFFSNDSALTTLILRKTSGVVTLGNTNAFNNTVFKSGGAGGTIYVPSALISSYQSASNWSTIHGYGTITWKAIEGSQYENYYADGTAIS